tara:strand:- start:8 stop:718 length:711 start_codon:yes stop_codon:yes gene_type:complete
MHKKADKLYLILSAIFIASLVGCNLIFLKFFSVDIPIPFYGYYTFEQSVGLLPYPITFLVTDIISEIYGRKKANDLVTAGLVASVFILIVVNVANVFPAAEWSNIKDTGFVDDKTFSHVFGLAGAMVFASMVAYLFAQYIDVRLFHFWKRLTNGKHLWLRNNASTISSQLIDTSIVLLLLCYLGSIPWVDFWKLFFNGVLFKMFFAAFDTPFIYLITAHLRKKFNLKFGEEVSIHT